MNDDLSIAILGWKSPVTTRHSLETYQAAGLYDCCGEFFVYYNQYSEADKQLCDEMGVRSCGGPENLGNWGGQEKILEQAKGDYVLFLENDHPIVTTREETKRWISAAVDLLRRDRADIVFLRHRQKLGDGYPFDDFFRYHYLNEIDPRVVGIAPDIPPNAHVDTPLRWLRRHLRPLAAKRREISALYLEKNPERRLPTLIRRENDFLITDSRILNFSESPFMTSKAFYRRITDWARRHPRHRTILGHQELEYIFNCRWWRQQHFRLATCDTGVFGHHRMDDSWRPTHAAFNQTVVDEGQKKDHQ